MVGREGRRRFGRFLMLPGTSYNPFTCRRVLRSGGVAAEGIGSDVSTEDQGGLFHSFLPSETVPYLNRPSRESGLSLDKDS